ncbi:tRNA/rRNA methyltransferase (SpoU) family protein [Tasmannia lanceolata]|uniref:tRNA/rRNA methyltransferase (SpoU) family protein n=1 Tax=Tasmannia lanceolata TaxID=3420 RepID=UPI004063FAF5
MYSSNNGFLHSRFPLLPLRYISKFYFSLIHFFSMPIMYSSFAKGHAFPLVSRASGRPKCFNSSQSFQIHSFSNGCQKTINFSNGFHQKTLDNNIGAKPRIFFCGFYHQGLENINKVKPRNFSNGFRLKTLESINIVRARNFSNGSHQNAMESNREVKPRKNLPWIASYKSRETKGSEKMPTARTSRSSWEESAETYFLKNGSKPSLENWESKTRMVDDSEKGRRDFTKMEVEVVEEDEDVGPIDDPRWDRIKNKYKRIIDRETRPENPEIHTWNKQENWGRKTWKEATESTVPKMVGEGIYGVGPVSAALTVGRRQFYTLYVQEGMDLSGNNRKKKDKRGIEKAIRIAEKIGLTVKEASKHDLNMVVDNRPHQGLVLDASPLEMVSIRELDPVLVEGVTAPLWVALDEVTDPQNLGAIVRSSYFFGAAGVVLCAKNSAPLSGVVSKASAGSLELIELRSCKNMMQFLASSVENGWRVLGGSVSSKAVPLNEVAGGAPTILVLGSEGTGLRPLVERSCTQLIRIPGNTPMGLSAGGVEGEESEGTDPICSGKEYQSFVAVESLNVSVAAGVLLYHLVGSTNHFLGGKKVDGLE